MDIMSEIFVTRLQNAFFLALCNFYSLLKLTELNAYRQDGLALLSVNNARNR